MVDEASVPPKPKHDWDVYGVVIASLIGLVAVLVSGYTAFLQNRQVRAQVWPRIELSRDGGRHTLMATNNGVGPARVTAMKVTVDGRPVKYWRELLDAIGQRGDWAQSQISRRVLPPGTTVDMLIGGPGEGGRQLINGVADALWEDKAPHRVGILLCYCSVLDECWLAGIGQLGNLTVDEDEQIGDCPIADRDRFRQ